jgi:hypothetical protein
VALELPGWVVIAFNYAGLPWPGIDEDELRAWATSVRTFAGDITGNAARTHQVVAGLADSQQSSFTATLAARWEQHNQLIADLHEPLNVFADALDVAADVVVAQKLVVIGAAVAFATEFAATQIGAFLTLGADEAALPEEIISTREIIDFAIEELKGALIGELVNVSVQGISDHIGNFIGNLLTGGLQVVTEYQSLKISYSALRDAAQSIRGQAEETQETGDTAYAENANRDIEDPGEAEATADGWEEVVQAVKQALLDLARPMFMSLPQVIMRAQEDASENLSDAAEVFENADSAEGQAAPHDSGQGPSPQPGNVVPDDYPDDAQAEFDWTRLPEFDGQNTVGIYVAPDGTEYTVHSGGQDPGLRNYISAGHVEGKVALRIRRDGWSDGGLLYINNINGIDPHCDSQLPTLLPEGKRLVVVPPPGATAKDPRWVDTPKPYTGNARDPKWRQRPLF